MFEVRLQPRADAAFQMLPLSKAVEVLHKLDNAEKVGVLNEQKIGIVNGNFLVHLMYASGYHLVSFWPTSTLIIAIADILPFRVTNRGSKTKLIQDAASEFGVVISQMTIV